MSSVAPTYPPDSINDKGWLEPVRRIVSPNFNARPDACTIRLLVIHNISLPPGEYGGGYIESFFSNQLDASKHSYFKTISDLQVSAHCLIARDGRVTQFVSFLDRAWHAGASSFEGEDDCNDYSIGIELEGEDNSAYTVQQYQSLMTISKLVVKHYPAVSRERVVGHSDIAPGRKTDPGPAFDWAEYLSSWE